MAWFWWFWENNYWNLLDFVKIILIYFLIFVFQHRWSKWWAPEWDWYLVAGICLAHGELTCLRNPIGLSSSVPETIFFINFLDCFFNFCSSTSSWVIFVDSNLTGEEKWRISENSKVVVYLETCFFQILLQRYICWVDLLSTFRANPWLASWTGPTRYL